jgi:hypothetical protein
LIQLSIRTPRHRGPVDLAGFQVPPGRSQLTVSESEASEIERAAAPLSPRVRVVRRAVGRSEVAQEAEELEALLQVDPEPEHAPEPPQAEPPKRRRARPEPEAEEPHAPAGGEA